VDADGVRVFEKSGDHRMAPTRLVVTVLVTAAVAVVALSATAVVLLRREPGTRVPREASIPAAEPPRVAARPVIPVRSDTIPPVPAGRAEHGARLNRRAPTANAAANRPPANAASDHVQDTTPEAAAAEREHRQLESMARNVIEGLKASGETRGLAAFPPPGTDPIKTGLVVPENFELPEGYVRHYQITDDGKRLEPILMFSPDYKFVDANGQPVALPKDGIVPPDMAPPGLPLHTLELPKPPRTAAGSRADPR
jgi:hypothetical protein